MLSDYENKLKCIITGDEAWIQANIVLKARPDRKEQVKVVQKSRSWWQFFSIFVVWIDFLPPRQTVNKEYYLSVMRGLREAIRLKRPELWANNSWFLHHNNAPFHTAFRQKFHAHRFATTVFAWFGSVWLLAIPRNSRDHSGERVSNRLTR